MDTRVQPHASRDHSGSYVRAAVHMDRTVAAESSAFPGSCQVQMGNALRCEVVSGDWVQQPHVQVADGLGLPAGPGKILEHAGDLQSVPVGHQPQRAQVDR